MEGRHAVGVMVQQALAPSEDRLPIGMVRAGPGQQMLKGQFLRLVFALGQFLEHHLPFHLEFHRIEPWFEHQVQEQIEGFGSPGRGNENVKVHIIETGGGIAAAAEGLDSAVEFARAQGPAALEDHVLQKMGHAAFLSRFRGTAGPAPEIDAGERRVRTIHLHHRDGVVEQVANRSGCVAGAQESIRAGVAGSPLCCQEACLDV